jgi:myo-inositol 2-dehydrogenase/D-chiro-inositol 1-dehydrogenase
MIARTSIGHKMRGGKGMTRSWGVAVIGTGDMGNRHIAAWQALGHRVVSVTDVDTTRAHEAANRFGVETVFADYADAVADARVEIVSICLPLAFHAPVTIAAAQHGKHVLCEKPLARSFAEVEAMEAAVREAGVTFGLGLQRNLAEGVGMLRQLAAAGEFGRPMVFSADLLQEVRPKRAMHDRQGNNGPLMDAGIHYFMMWQTVFRSKPKAVYAQGRILAMDRPEVAGFDQLAIDTAVVTVEFESGDLATITVSWGLAAGSQMRGRGDRVFGPKGGAEGEVNRELRVYRGDAVETLAIEPKDLHEVEFAAFVDALERGTQPPSGFVAGKQMLALTQAMLRSIDSGRVEVVDYGF